MSEVIYDFSGKNFVVIGASSGIGRQVAKELAQSGAKVLAIARRADKLKSLAQEVENTIAFSAIDVLHQDKMAEAVEEFIQQNGKLNGCVYTVGIGGLTPLKAFDPTQAKRIMELSFWQAIFCMQLLVKKKYTEVGSSYVFFSSVAASTGEKGMFAYAAAKTAIRTAVKSFAKEICGGGHRVNTISPGWVKTEMTEGALEIDSQEKMLAAHLLGTGQITDVSGVALFLLSDRAGWITGTDIVVDGGYLA